MSNLTHHQNYKPNIPSEDQREQIAQMKLAFPYRIAYGALNPQTNEFIASAVATLHIPNKLAREGWMVWTA